MRAIAVALRKSLLNKHDRKGRPKWMQLEELFKRADRDNSSLLDRDEFARAMALLARQSQSPPPSHEVLRLLFAQLDADACVRA